MSLKSQTRDPQLKVPPGGLVLRIFTSWKKSINLSRIWNHEPWISKPARYPETTEADKFFYVLEQFSDMSQVGDAPFSPIWPLFYHYIYQIFLSFYGIYTIMWCLNKQYISDNANQWL